MHPEIARSASRNSARASSDALISSLRDSMASASSTSASVHSPLIAPHRGAQVLPVWPPPVKCRARGIERRGGAVIIIDVLPGGRDPGSGRTVWEIMPIIGVTGSVFFR